MIKIKKSAKIFDVIYNEDANIKSIASLILLNDYYKHMDVDLINDKKNLFKYLRLRHKFLLKTKKKNGDLVCHYCGKNHLEIGFLKEELLCKNNLNNNLATIDHKIPISQNIDKLDTNNWLVCCKNCNKSKGNSDYDTFLKSKILKKRILNNKQHV